MWQSLSRTIVYVSICQIRSVVSPKLRTLRRSLCLNYLPQRSCTNRVDALCRSINFSEISWFEELLFVRLIPVRLIDSHPGSLTYHHSAPTEASSSHESIVSSDRTSWRPTKPDGPHDSRKFLKGFLLLPSNDDAILEGNNPDFDFT